MVGGGGFIGLSFGEESVVVVVVLSGPAELSGTGTVAEVRGPEEEETVVRFDDDADAKEDARGSHPNERAIIPTEARNTRTI